MLDLLLAISHELEDLALNVALMDADRPAAELIPVHDDVVRFGPHGAWIRLKKVNIFIHRSRERVVHGIPTFFVFVPLKQWWSDNPGGRGNSRIG